MFKPLLAATIDDANRLMFPLLASPKLDGIRCIILDGLAMSRNLKPIRNTFIQEQICHLPHGMDGELIVGPPYGELVFNRTTSGVMSEEGTPDFMFYVFDLAFHPFNFMTRLQELQDKLAVCPSPHVEFVNHELIESQEDLEAYERYCLQTGYEGVMLRKMEGYYKNGRSTMNEQILMKLKRFRDGEALIVGFGEGITNLNEPTVNELGYMKRSNHKDNKMASGQVGRIFGKDLTTGEEIVISPGRMTQPERVHYFENPNELIGNIAKYKTFDYGRVAASRFCTFQGLRHKDDL